MRRWERRLADLAHLLETCGAAYFEPELFRMNTNQFLTTARTVTFLIQKEKASIPDFQRWYSNHVIAPWSGDPVMTWAKESRNHIEKEGDLDLYSELSTTLIFSYIESNDIKIQCSRAELLTGNIKRLLRYAEKHLPSGVSDAAVLRIERRWVANTLNSHELLQALAYVYARILEVARALALHLESKLPKEIPGEKQFDELLIGNRRTSYITFSDRKHGTYIGKSFPRSGTYKPPSWLSDLMHENPLGKRGKTLKEQVEFQSKMAVGTFVEFGNHMPFLHLFDAEGRVIDLLSAALDSQTTKFIFWRQVADRISLLRAASLVWVSEVWVREHDKTYATPIRKMRIKGELLHVVGMDSKGQTEMRVWDIERYGPDVPPRLVQRPSDDDYIPRVQNFLEPARKAFERLYGKPSVANAQ